MNRFRLGRAGHRGLRAGMLSSLILLGLQSPCASAWSEHASLVWPLLRAMPALLEPTLAAEPLEDFLAADPQGLAAVLDAHEQWARSSLATYAARPESLAFDPGAADLRTSFLEAIRVNPTLPYRLYYQPMIEDTPPAGETLGLGDMSFLTVDETHADIRYQPLAAGDVVSAAQVLAAASDEPDFGMDIGLFEDNGTSFGTRYGFGEQPFGNPNLEYSSQAPFHMGFYYPNWLLAVAQPSVAKTYPRWRVDLYRSLAEYAFAGGHDYWGWRFMGWALHYIGDLTQPYHADPLPGMGPLDMLWALATGASADAIQLVSNRHGVLESYQYQRVRRALEARAWDSVLLTAIASAARETPLPFTRDTLHTELAAASVAAAADLDSALEQYLPAHFVSDPSFEWNDSGEAETVVERVRSDGGDAAVAAMDDTVAVQLRRFSRYAAAWASLAYTLSSGSDSR